MSIISYAQNFEDVMLWRALKHVENGFYIDVGANDPIVDSVTNTFYEHGWSGINIEPLSSHYDDLQRERPRDVNLQCAAGAVSAEIDLWECEVRGWATADKSVIALHEENGHVGEFHKVPVLPLAEICNANVKGEIHFLKIDVEGFEKPVIEGMDFSNFRPWILVIEATRPNSAEEVYDEWESIVLSSNYLLAYTDGLNRFYVASEHPELLDALHYPPNVFDAFIRAEQLNSELRAQQAQAQLSSSETQSQSLQNELNAAKAKIDELGHSSHHWWCVAENQSHELKSVYASKSWRITKPVRLIWKGISMLIKVLLYIPITLVKIIWRGFKWPFKYLLSVLMRFILKRPKLKSKAKAILTSYPRLQAHLRRFAGFRNITSRDPTICHGADESKVKSLEMMRDVDLAIKQHAKNVSVIFLEQK